MSEQAASAPMIGRRERLGRLPLLAPLQVRDYRLVWFGESVAVCLAGAVTGLARRMTW